MEINSPYQCGNCALPLRHLTDPRTDSETCIVCHALNFTTAYDGPRLLSYDQIAIPKLQPGQE